MEHIEDLHFALLVSTFLINLMSVLVTSSVSQYYTYLIGLHCSIVVVGYSVLGSYHEAEPVRDV